MGRILSVRSRALTRASAFLATMAPAGALGAQEPGSPTAVELHGSILLNGFRNGARVNNSDVPTVVLPPAAGTSRSSSLGGTVRQTRLTATIRNDAVLGARLFGELDVDFFGGQQPSGGGRSHPLPRIRRAYGELRWTNVTLLVGQEAPPIAEINPTSLASVGFPLFSSSGNLWLWLPQIRVTAWLTPPGGVRIGLEGAALAPSTGEPQDPFFTAPDRGERSGRPAFEGRVVARWSGGGRPGSASLGGHYGWFVRPDDSLANSRAVAAALSAPLGPWLELRGEAWSGRGLAGLGGGGIGQLVSENGLSPVRSEGGWGQLILLPTPSVELGFGLGIDDPRDADVGGAGAKTRNRTYAVNVTARAAPFVIGAEVRQTRTSYLGPPLEAFDNTHLNLGVGFEF